MTLKIASQKIATNIIFLISITFCGCNNNSVDWAVLEQEYKVKPDDSIKLQAVHFLKNNIKGMKSEVIYFHNPLSGKDLYLKDLDYKKYNEKNIRRLLKNEYQIKHYFVEDESILTTGRIRDEINTAYQAWITSPWYKETPKSIFFEYLLPYKISEEYPDKWRRAIKNEKYNISFSHNNHNYEINKKEYIKYFIKKIVRQKQNKFYTYSEETLTLSETPSFKEVAIVKGGDCHNGSHIATYFDRTNGIPAAVDIVPYWGSMNGAHMFDVHWDPVDKKMVKEWVFEMPVTKIFRRTFINQGGWSQKIKPLLGKLSFSIPHMKTDFLKDVTDEHVATQSITMEIPKTSHVPFAYLTVYSYGSWKPVDWAPVNNNQAIFKKMGANMLYRLALPNNKGFSVYGNMFYIDTYGNRIKPNVSDTTVSLQLNAINHGTDAFIKKGNNLTLYLVDSQGELKYLESKTCEKDKSVNFDKVPKALFYLLRQDDAPVDLARFFTMKNGKQDWLWSSPNS